MMYFLNRKKMKDIVDDLYLSGVMFGIENRSYKIDTVIIKNLEIYDKKLAHPIAVMQVKKKYEKLMNILPDLLISDDDSGESIRSALNEIERFRQIIKNKYREYLKEKDLKLMSSQLKVLQREAKAKYLEMQNSYRYTSFKGSSK